MLTLCDKNHDPIAFYKPIGGGCPLCAAPTREDLQETVDASNALEEETSRLQDTIDILREQLSATQARLTANNLPLP